jgi:hypothetical protein
MTPLKTPPVLSFVRDSAYVIAASELVVSTFAPNGQFSHTSSPDLAAAIISTKRVNRPCEGLYRICAKTGHKHTAAPCEGIGTNKLTLLSWPPVY